MKKINDGYEPSSAYEGVVFQEGLFPTDSEIAFHDLFATGEQNREEEFILSRCGAYLERNPFYTGRRTPHPEECDDDGNACFGYGYYEVENMHSNLQWLADRVQVEIPYESGIEDDDCIPF